MRLWATLLGMATTGFLGGCEKADPAAPAEPPRARSGSVNFEIQKTDPQWREQLTESQYEITRGNGTERAFTGKYWNHKEPGVYACLCCGQELFSSKTKFDSGSGWPSYWAPVNETHVHAATDTSLGMVRSEAACSRCGAHLGHVFDDGPEPTGLRYCINSASLQFTKGSPDK